MARTVPRGAWRRQGICSLLDRSVPVLQHHCSMTATPQKQPPVDDELRRATIDVLRERSFSGLTLERVAEVAGRARSTLWRQGHSRETLVGALAGELAEDFR